MNALPLPWKILKDKGNPNFTIIGHMTQESEGSFSDSCQYKIALKARGWDALTQ
jgi:thiamine-monophosphate kinase